MTEPSELFSSGGVQIRLEGIRKHYSTEAGEVEALSKIDLVIDWTSPDSRSGLLRNIG